VKHSGGKRRLLRGGDGQAEEASHIECVKDDGLALWKIIGIAGSGLIAASLCGVLLFCFCCKSTSKLLPAKSGAAVVTQNGMVIGIPIPAVPEQRV